MRAVMAAAVFALLMGSAYGQGLPPLGIPMGGEPTHKELPPEKENEYRSAIKGLPDRKSADPWGTVRSQTPAPQGKQTSGQQQAKKKSEKTEK
jgi:hypothetical protein